MGIWTKRAPEVDTRFTCKAEILKREKFQHEKSDYVLIHIKLRSEEGKPANNEEFLWRKMCFYDAGMALCAVGDVVDTWCRIEDGKVVLIRVDFPDSPKLTNLF